MSGKTNQEFGILDSAARTASTNSANQRNNSAKGVMLFLNVSANPGGLETLTLSVEMLDPISGLYRAITAFAATTAAVNATYLYTVFPGALETAAVANHEVQGLPLPMRWRVRVVHSAAGSWTYSVSGQYIS